MPPVPLRSGPFRLTPFPAGDGELVSSWATDPVEVVQWCGVREAPVPADTIRGWAEDESVLAYALHDDAGLLVAYGELWLDDDGGEVELARLIVHSGHRNRGVGRALVGELGRVALTYHPDVYLRVHPDNAAALRCYQAAGLVPVAAGQQAEWNAPQRVAYIWLRLPA